MRKSAQLGSLTALLLASSVLAMGAPGWRLHRFESTISVLEDGSGIIHERLDLSCPPTNPVRDLPRIQRVIPVESAGPLGTKRRLDLKVLGVTDNNGSSLAYHVRVWGGRTEIRVLLPGCAAEPRTVEIEYFIRNLVRFRADHDDVYWNLTSSTLPVPAEQASATVLLPENASEGLRAQGFIGGHGGGTISGHVHGESVEFVAPGAVGALRR
jgi:hypothetical protein